MEEGELLTEPFRNQGAGGRKVCEAAFGVWRTIDGRPVCIEDKWAKPTFALAMVLIASALVGGGAASAAAIGGTAAAESAASQSLNVKVSRGKSSARQGRHNEAWLRMGLRSLSRQIRNDRDCVAHSSGQVRKCLRLEPCTGLQRTLTTIVDDQGNAIVVSVAWVRMPDRVSARHFQRLADTLGTGNISPITSEVGVRFTGRHYVSRRSGSLVVIAEATTGSGQPAAAVLDAVADVAVEFPWSEG